MIQEHKLSLYKKKQVCTHEYNCLTIGISRLTQIRLTSMREKESRRSPNLDYEFMCLQLLLPKISLCIGDQVWQDALNGCDLTANFYFTTMWTIFIVALQLQ